MKGTPELRRRFSGLPAIRVAAGTRNKRTVRALDKMLCDLRDAGRFDYLRLIADKAVTPLALYARLTGMDYRLLPPPAIQPLADLVEAWRKGERDEVSRAQRANDRWAWKRLLARASKDATAEDVPGLVKAERAACKASGQFPAFNHAKAAALAFLRDTLTVRSRIYADVLDIPALPKKAQREGHPCDPPEALAVLTALPAMEYRAIWWTMCSTGMDNGELWGRWEMEDGHLRIHGTKRQGRDRLVPVWAGTPWRPSVSAKLFAAALKTATKGTVQPRDGRRTYALWLSKAGVDQVDQDALMGHGVRTMTELYQRGNVGPRLAAIAERLRTWLIGSVEKLPEMLRIGGSEMGAGKGIEAVATVTDAPRRSRTPNLLIRSQSPKADRKRKRRSRKAQQVARRGRRNPETAPALPEILRGRA